MESKTENGILTIQLCERIDSANAADVEREIFSLAEKSGARSIVLDAAGCRYISSAGLRVILKLKKTSGDVKVTDVSPELYEIFKVTGFADILSVEKALREISVEGCEVIGEGGYGVVYRLDSDTIVKLYKAADVESIKREIDYAKKAFLKGVPTAISYDIVKCGDMYGVVLEMIRSDMLASHMVREPEKFDEYMDKYVGLIRCVHSTDLSDTDCPRTRDVYRKVLQEGVREYLTDGEWTALMDILDSVPDRQTMIHGDIHAKNIMMQDGEPLLIDMDEIMRGHPIYDIAGIYFVYTYLTSTGRNERMLGMSAEMCMHFLDVFFEKYLADIAEEKRRKVMEGVKAFAGFREAYAVFLFEGKNREKAAFLAEELRKKVLPFAAEIAEAAGAL